MTFAARMLLTGTSLGQLAGRTYFLISELDGNSWASRSISRRFVEGADG